ncbi:hypothetical protein KC19_1G316100 [Ceratodon purpureus]|uniref:Uncharacterized protein n=1 Tax=Ceratodon purpureus TaxID=3225 RepID=A0A8T0JBH5_CERPU|nr:hypothetical protein KC19_1G316100 [Ceratodon purpureus]
MRPSDARPPSPGPIGRPPTAQDPSFPNMGTPTGGRGEARGPSDGRSEGAEGRTVREGGDSTGRETGGGSSSSGDDDAVNATPSSLHGVRTSDRGAWPRSHAPDTPSSPGNLSLLGCLRQSFPALVELGAVILPGRSWCWWCTRREVGERSCVAEI